MASSWLLALNFQPIVWAFHLPLTALSGKLSKGNCLAGTRKGSVPLKFNQDLLISPSQSDNGRACFEWQHLHWISCAERIDKLKKYHSSSPSCFLQRGSSDGQLNLGVLTHKVKAHTLLCLFHPLQPSHQNLTSNAISGAVQLRGSTDCWLLAASSLELKRWKQMFTIN